MKITTRGHTELRWCPNCFSDHIGGPCGMTAAERFATVSLATDWMPAKQRDREIGKAKGGKDYYDDEQIKEAFGQSGKDNFDEMMEETQGVGLVTPEDIQKHPELVAAHYLDNPKDEIGDE